MGINDRLYKTGDLARYLPDGNIDYLGRNDSQVKIRGFRIELGEIESVLNTVPGISQSVVLAKENNKGTKYLVGYYASRESISEDLLIQTLKKSVPEYMVPSFFIHMECLPVTNNGKLDRKSLPEPEFVDKNTYVAPENNLQESLCQIYADVLGLDINQVGINDDFFKLGGDSILAIRLVNKIKTILEIHVNIGDIFSLKNINRICKLSDNNDKPDTFGIRILKVDNPEKQMLSFAQERLWFLNNFEKDSKAYNVPLFFKLSSNISFDYLFHALQQIINRHEILRTLIKVDFEGKDVCVLPYGGSVVPLLQD